MGLTQDLVEHIVGTGFDSLDAATVERAKWRVLDACGCALAGAEAPGCREMWNLVTGWGGAPESTILGHGGRAPAHNVAMLNSLMTRSYDYEPVEAEFDDRTGPAHISGTTVPTALAMADKQAANGERLLTALVVGDDIAARLGVNSGFDFSLGWDNTGTINVFGATAIACKLLQLSEQQVFNALGIALNRLSGTMAGVFDKTLAFKLPIAFSSREGIVAAELAQQGFPGIDEPFLGPRGYFSMYCRDHDADQVTKDLGKRFYSDCVIKPYSSCRMTHAFIDCALAIAKTNDIDIDEVATVNIHATQRVADSFCGQPFSHSDLQQPDGAFSIRYCVAAVLLWREVGPPQFTAEFLHDQRVGHLIGRMRLVGDIPPARARDREVEIEVVMRDGRVLSARAGGGIGGIGGTRLSVDETKAKFLTNVAFAQMVAEEDAERAMSVIERLEDVGTCRHGGVAGSGEVGQRRGSAACPGEFRAAALPWGYGPRRRGGCHRGPPENEQDPARRCPQQGGHRRAGSDFRRVAGGAGQVWSLCVYAAATPRLEISLGQCVG
jgi:2-methylcitrate dehydratase PrpD